MTPATTTISRHLSEEQVRLPDWTRAILELLNSFALVGKIISREVSRAGLSQGLDENGSQNSQGEQVTKLDVLAHNLICHVLSHSFQVCIMVSEESESPLEVPDNCSRGNYVVLFDPLDGSSNIEINASVGTIFSIYRRISIDGKGTIGDCLQAGIKQVCAGYILYGSSTMLVYTMGYGVHAFTLDPYIGEFLMSHENIKIPARGNYYSINEGSAKHWTAGIADYLDSLKSVRSTRPPTLRYIGALVADFHRTLLSGGIFLYPANTHYPEGRLRLLYEAAPLAFISEQAGGRATTGSERILELKPKTLHQRVPLIIGSWEDVLDLEKFILQARSKAA